MEPLTEHRQVAGPVVYGYLRLARASATRQAALAASLAEYCRQHELLLSGVFTERSTSQEVAFIGLLDVLALPDTYGVVLPSASHLGPKAIAAAREKQIEAAGARLLLIRSSRQHRSVGHRFSSPSSAARPRRRALDAET
ncbi:hypothetical protein [Streptomyces sp. RPT161]|uniref:hypothetical protein n=1 Tax=Streptomyces sp. RPT161 TaxID=3015993 RepID=UPI0022B8BF78|nr:hypothetical protein [Streptomyces sp. RPT161]